MDVKKHLQKNKLKVYTQKGVYLWADPHIYNMKYYKISLKQQVS